MYLSLSTFMENYEGWDERFLIGIELESESSAGHFLIGMWVSLLVKQETQSPLF